MVKRFYNITSITTTLDILHGEKVRRRTWTKEEAEAAAKARLEVRRQEDNMVKTPAKCVNLNRA